MKIEYIEESLTTVLNYFQKDYKDKKGNPIKHFRESIVDTARGVVVFKACVDDGKEWNRRFTQAESSLITKKDGDEK